VFKWWPNYPLERIGGKMGREHAIPEEIKPAARLAGFAAHLYSM
jgi:hypothetical protein